MDGIVILIVVLVGAIVGLVTRAIKVQQKQIAYERSAREAFAQQYGLHFVPQHAGLHHSLSHFDFFQQGHNHNATNVMQGLVDDIDVTIADYSYTVGSGDSARSYTKTIFVLQSDEIHIPKFAIQPERSSMFDIFGSKGMDINYRSDPDFSNKYRLYSPHGEVIGRLFGSSALRAAFTSIPSLCFCEAFEDTIVYHVDQKLDPKYLLGTLQQVQRIYHALRAEL